VNKKFLISARDSHYGYSPRAPKDPGTPLQRESQNQAALVILKV